MKLKAALVSAVALFGLIGSALAGEFVNSTPAVQGYDVVSYQQGSNPVRGSGHFTAVHDGETYLFASKENLATFKQDPERYVPAYGGFCAFGVSVGKKFVGDPEVWKVVDNRLYLNLDKKIQGDWEKDVPGRIKSADKQWLKIKDENPAAL